MRNLGVYRTAVALALIGALIFLYKWLYVGFPLNAGKQANAWQIETDIHFTASGGAVQAITFIPQSMAGQLVHDVRLVAAGYGTVTRDETPNRLAQFTIRSATGQQALYTSFVVQRYPERQEPAISAREREALRIAAELAKSRRQRATLSEPQAAAAQALIELARQRSADDRSMVTLLIKTLIDERASDSVRLLLGRDRSSSRIARVAVAALGNAGHVARVVNGLDVTKEGRLSDLEYWIEVLLDDRWVSFFTATGEPAIPPGYLAWWRGDSSLITLVGGESVTRRIAVQRLKERELDQVITRGQRADLPLVTFSMYALPISVQRLYRILFMIPVGVFLLVIMRNLIGIKGLGTFMPVLVALAFRETTLVWGLVLFTSIMAVGLLARLYLENLKLLLAPRLAAIVMIVILLMAIISVFAHKLGFDRGLSVALFPIVILTMTIERISIIWDERGGGEAVREATQTLAIATICYLVMSLQVLQYVLFTFPELILVLLAATLLIGRYSGYRLTELSRFRSLAGERK